MDLPTSRCVLWYGGASIQEFLYHTNTWERNPDLMGVLIGSPETRHITHEEARRIIEDSGGTWVEPPGPTT